MMDLKIDPIEVDINGKPFSKSEYYRFGYHGTSKEAAQNIAEFGTTKPLFISQSKFYAGHYAFGRHGDNGIVIEVWLPTQAKSPISYVLTHPVINTNIGAKVTATGYTHQEYAKADEEQRKRDEEESW